MAEAVTKVVTKDQLEETMTAGKAIMDGLAGYIPEKKTVTLPVANWQTDANNEDYPVYQDVTVSGITTDDRADIVFSEALIDTVAECGVSPITTVTAANTVRVRAVAAPETALTATAWIIYGKGN